MASDSDDDTFDNYSIEFDDADTEKDVSKKGSKISTQTNSAETKKEQSNETKKYQKPKHICRICLKRCNKKAKNASEYAFIYLKCTGFTFEDGQGPKKLCHPCINELLKVENFIEKCTETEQKLTKGLLPKFVEPADESFSEYSDVDVVIDGEDDTPPPKLPKTLPKKMPVKPKPDKEKKIKKEKKCLKKEDKTDESGTKNQPKSDRRGRPPMDPAEKKARLEMRIQQKRLSSMDEFGEFRPVGRPKNSFKVKKDPGQAPVPVQNEINEAPERQICFVCGKLVRTKQLPHHLWKHRKDEEPKTTDGVNNTCEFCNKSYKTEELKKSHMKRVHPAVAYGNSQGDESPDSDGNDDNFEKEFHVPPKEPEYPTIQSPYTHIRALQNLQTSIRR